VGEGPHAERDLLDAFHEVADGFGRPLRGPSAVGGEPDRAEHVCGTDTRSVILTPSDAGTNRAVAGGTGADGWVG
jgi:hypothetical protein